MVKGLHLPIILILLVADGLWSFQAEAKPRRHPAEIDLILRAEWDGDFENYPKEVEKQTHQDLQAAEVQRQSRLAEEKQLELARKNYKLEVAQQRKQHRHEAARAVYEEKLRNQKIQNELEHQYARERAVARTQRRQRHEIRMDKFKHVRLALIHFLHRQHGLRKPAMIKMPKPDEATLKALKVDANGAEIVPPLPAPQVPDANPPPQTPVVNFTPPSPGVPAPPMAQPFPQAPGHNPGVHPDQTAGAPAMNSPR